jgi:hypothetical protein
MTHSKRAILVSRVAHITMLSALMTLTWVFIFTVL